VRLAERLPDRARIFGAWGSDRELAAATLEQLDGLTRLFARAHGVKRVGPPLRIRRPWEKTPKQTAVGKALALRRLIGGG